LWLDWEGNEVESRKLNGIYATLETSEWTMIKIFDELAYKHYKKNWNSMLRQKFRLRLTAQELYPGVITHFHAKLHNYHYVMLESCNKPNLPCSWLKITIH
jgi:hypothetical protein